MGRLRSYWYHLSLFHRLLWLVYATSLAVLIYVWVGLPRLGLLPVVILVWYLAYKILGRSLLALQTLVVAVDRMKFGHYDAVEPVQGAPELRMLTSAFNAGLSQIKRLIDELRRRESQQNEFLERITAQNFAYQEERRSINAAVLVVETDTEGKITYVNDKYCEFTGHTRGELIGHNHPLLTVRASEHDERAGFWQTLRAGNVWSGEFHDRTSRGEDYWIQSTIVPIQDDFGHRPRFFKIISIDITARKRLDLLLREERERAEVTLASIGDAVISTNLQGHVTFLNDAAAVLIGYGQDEAQGQLVSRMFDLVHETTRQPIENPVIQALSWLADVRLTDHTVLVTHDGREFGIDCTAAPIVMGDGSLIGTVLVFHDVSERRRLLSAVKWQAGHDALTRLPNRHLLSESFTRVFAMARQDETLTAVCLLDLDNFKPINDTWGHETGDMILVEIADRLVNALREQDTVARLGGDEFVLLLNGFRNVEEADPLLQRLLQTIAEPIRFDGQDLAVCGSIGLTFFPLDDADADTLLRHADQAMYQAKQAGRSRYHLFDLVTDQQVQTRFRVIERVRHALYAGELALYYQPKVNMRTGQVVGMEGLLRWLDPQLGLVPPAEFLPVVEDNELINEIGEWVIETALTQQARWLRAGLSWVVSINIAGKHFQREDFSQRLAVLLGRHPEVPPELLQIEILESAAIGDLRRARGTVSACHLLGVSFALDDFGTGYSSLSYLKNLSVNTLKIDQSFVRDMLVDREGLSLVEAVISLARIFDSEVVAEGVESTLEQGVLLLRLGCDVIQGYGVARPMPADEVETWVTNWSPDPAWQQWGDVAWDLSDFQLVRAQLEHMHRVRRMIELVSETDSPGQKDLPVVKVHECGFGQWIYGKGQARYGQLEEFREIESLHRRVHELGTRMRLLHDEGEDQVAREQCVPELLELQARILMLLASLQRGSGKKKR